MTREQINRAMDKAHDQARNGNLPTLVATELVTGAIHETWMVDSRTHRGTTYTVSLCHDCESIRTSCICPAGQSGKCCWHRALARLGHTDSIAINRTTTVRYRAKSVVAVTDAPATDDQLTAIYAKARETGVTGAELKHVISENFGHTYPEALTSDEALMVYGILG